MFLSSERIQNLTAPRHHGAPAATLAHPDRFSSHLPVSRLPPGPTSLSPTRQAEGPCENPSHDALPLKSTHGSRLIGVKARALAAASAHRPRPCLLPVPLPRVELVTDSAAATPASSWRMAFDGHILVSPLPHPGDTTPPQGALPCLCPLPAGFPAPALLCSDLGRIFPLCRPCYWNAATAGQGFSRLLPAAPRHLEQRLAHTRCSPDACRVRAFTREMNT